MGFQGYSYEGYCLHSMVLYGSVHIFLYGTQRGKDGGKLNRWDIL